MVGKRIWLFSVCMLMSHAALALQMEYYTYDGFSQTLDAFRKIALIFSDNDYIVLFGVFAILGIFLGGSIFYGKAVIWTFDGKANHSLSWLIVPIIGTFIFKALIIPKGEIHIYDSKLNSYTVVEHIPNLIILAAGVVNKIERSVVRIIDNSGATPYSKDAGGLSFKLLYDATQNTSGKIDYYLHKSLKKYYADCHPLALVNSTSEFDLDTLRSKTNNLMMEMAKLKSPAFYTQYYDSTHKSGELLSCSVAWDEKLKPALENTENTNGFLKHICKKNHFDPANALGFSACQNSLRTAIKVAYKNDSVTYDAFIRNSVIASSIAGAIQDANPDVGVRTLTNRAMINEGIGVALAAESWLPTIRATVTAIILGLLPILLLFMVTPLFPQVLNLTFSLFAWLALWGIVDAYLHQSTLDQMVHAFTQSSIHNMGLLAFWETPDSATKAMAIMGQARSMGITIATFIAATLFKLNAYSLSSIANRWSQQVDQEGKKAAEMSQSPQHSAEMVESLARSNATFGVSNQIGFGGMSDAAIYNSASNIGSALTAIDRTTGSAMTAGMGVGQIQGGAQAGNFEATSNAGDLSDVASRMARTDTESRIGHARGLEQAVEELGLKGGAAELSGIMTSISQKHAYGQSMSNQDMVNMVKQENPTLTDEQAWSALGTYQAVEKIAEINASNGNIGKFIEQKTEIQGMNMTRGVAGVKILDKFAQGMGMTPLEVATAQQSAHIPMAVTSAQAERLHEQGHISAIQSQTLTDGGVVSFAADNSEKLNMVSASASVNSSASTDHSTNWNAGTSFNEQTSIIKGVQLGNASSGMSVLTDASKVGLILAGENGKRDLALNAAEKLSSVYKITDSTHTNMGWQAGIGLVGTGVQHSKTGQYNQSLNAAYGVYSNMIDALYKEAEYRGYEPGFKDQWVSNEFAQLNKNIYGKFEEIAVERAGKKNINFAISEYFDSRGLTIAANKIEKDWMSYEIGSPLHKEAFTNKANVQNN